jgi:hypothetical protein
MLAIGVLAHLIVLARSLDARCTLDIAMIPAIPKLCPFQIVSVGFETIRVDSNLSQGFRDTLTKGTSHEAEAVNWTEF